MVTKDVHKVHCTFIFFNSVHLTLEAPRLMDRHFNINLIKHPTKINRSF